ncbi:diguanylate cyclase [Rhodospirillum rubrum]|uniref:diguanylate cyclase n=1 Tax=Rhodospirillum rubrum TaxID=1085 RepID=UPI0019065D7A|nr:diguanylate cyclase [Rhodospirillum rubrum]MBK1663033.1 diguanylate cyclase [Rhodospirillum rubrum]MBK1677623.1 diguanylate cyclase [Rhodospirillum rubrum]
MKRVPWVVGGLILIMGYNAALGALAYWQRRDIIDESLKDAVVVADILVREVEASLDRIDRTLSGLTEVLRAYPSAIDVHDPFTHRLLLRRHAITPSLAALFLIGGDGRLRNASLTDKVSEIDVSGEDYFAFHVANVDDEFFIGAVTTNRLDKSWVIPVSRAMRDSFGQLTGVVAATITTDSIDQMIHSHQLSEGFAVTITQRDAGMIGCLGFARCWGEGAPQRSGEGLAESGGGGEEADYLANGPGVGAFLRGSTYGVEVTVQASDRTLLQPWREKLAFIMVLQVLGTLGLGFGITSLYYQTHHRRLSLLDLENANASLESKVAERTRQLAEGEERMRGFIMAARDAVVIIDQKGIISEFNPSATELFGYDAEEVRGQSVNMLMPTTYARDHDGHLKKGKPSGQRAVGRGREMIGRRKNGSEFPIELTVGTQSFEGTRVHVGVIRDITERKATEETLRRLANTDGLTGVLNRRSFTEESELLLSLANRHGRPLAALIVDADHFKRVNDTYGHEAGDTVLKALTREIDGVLRKTDLLGRIGGEEFGVLLPETDSVGAHELAWRVVRTIRAMEVPLSDGDRLSVTVSVGVGYRSAEATTLDMILREADKALYAAKHGGRDRVVGFEAS